MYGTPSLATEYSFYTIIADGYVYGSSNSSGITLPSSRWNRLFTHLSSSDQFPAVIDSGTTFAHLPVDITHAFAAQFDPPAIYNDASGQYMVPCNATVPPFGVIIGSQTFFMSDEDLVQQQEKLDLYSDGIMYCLLGLVDGSVGPYILGDVFMNNVLSVFDIGASEMRFARRQ